MKKQLSSSSLFKRVWISRSFRFLFLLYAAITLWSFNSGTCSWSWVKLYFNLLLNDCSCVEYVCTNGINGCCFFVLGLELYAVKVCLTSDLIYLRKRRE